MIHVLLLFVLISAEICQGCINYGSIENADVSTYGQLSDAVDCCVPYISVLGSITLSSELNVISCNASIRGAAGAVVLYAPNSRVFNVENSTLAISNISLQGKSMLNVNGGVLFAVQSAIVIRGVYFEGGGAISGGALSADNSTIDITTSTFTGNTVSALGGAIYCSNGGTMILRDVEFRGNSAYSGGSLAVESCSLTLTNSHVESSTASQYGGCIYSSLSDLSLSTSSLTGCRVPAAVSGLEEDSQGGCLYATSHSSLRMVDSSLSNCSASMAGVLKLSASEASIDNSEFRDSSSSNSNMDLVGRLTEVTIRSSRFLRNRADMSTSALRCGLSAKCFFYNTTFDSNDAVFTAAISVDYKALAQFSHCTFKNNSAGSSAGAVSVSYAGIVHISSCVFDGNRAEQYGGGVRVSVMSEVKIEDSVFVNNLAVAGGALCIEFHSDLVLKNTTFDGNIADGQGGAIAVFDYSTAVVEYTKFSSCSAVYGGALYVYSHASLRLTNVEITDSRATYEGGCIAGYEYSTIVIDKSNLVRNSAVYGGAVFGQLYTTLNITDSEMYQNTASYTGGGVVVQDTSSLYVFNTTFVDNVAKFYGSVISATFSYVSVDSISAQDNQCSSDGGVVYITLSTFYAENSVFIANKAEQGGVISCGMNSSCATQSCSFIDNMATFGGAVFVTESSWSSESDLFLQNTASSAGGAVYGTEILVVRVHNAVLKGCKAFAGGAMSIKQGMYVSIEKSSFFANSAKSVGGALFLDSVEANVANCDFSLNYAVVNGGGMALIGSDYTIDENLQTDTFHMNVDNCSLVSNYANQTGGGMYGSGIDVKVMHLLVFNNTATHGAGISATKTAANISHSRFLNNTAVVGGGGVYWEYEKQGAMVSIDDSTCEDYGNRAIYGAFKATDVARLSAVRHSTSKEASGVPIEFPVFVDLKDFYDQVVIGSSESSNVIYSSTMDSISSIQGSTIETSTKGVATFGNITVTFKPDTNVTLLFSMSGDVEDGRYVLFFRSCEVGENVIALQGGTALCELCAIGTYSLHVKQECRECMENANCLGGNVINVNSGYWRVSEDSDSVRLCPSKRACKGGSNVAKQCRKGHRGMYCSVCQDGYYDRGGICKSCKSSGKDLLLSILPTVIIILVLLCYYLWTQRDNIRDYLSEKAVEASDKADDYRFRAVKTKFKIILAFVQIINQMPFVLNVDFPFTYVQFLRITWIFNLDFVEFLNFDCLYYRNFYDKLVTATIGPFILVGVLAIILYLRHCLAYRLNSINPSYTLEKFRTDAIFFSLLISFIVFSPVSIKILQTFACERFDDGSYMLIADYSISCSGDQYNFYVAYAAVMTVVYPIGVPTMYLILLYSFHDYVNPRTKLVVRDDERHLVSPAVIQEQKIRLRHTYNEIKIIAFLYETYEPRRWYFEVGDCIRRLMLTAVPVLIMRGTATQVILVLCVSLACVAAYMELKPFITESDNLVAVITQWAITLTLIVAIMIRVDEKEGPDRKILGLLAILINSMVFVLTIVLVFVTDDGTDEVIEKVKEDQAERRRAHSVDSKQKLSSFVKKTEARVAMAGADSDDELPRGSDEEEEVSGEGRQKKSTKRGSVTAGGFHVSESKTVSAGSASPPRKNKSRRGSVKMSSAASPEDSTGTRRSSVKLGDVSSTSSGSPTVSTEKRKSTSSKRNSFLAMLSTDQHVSEMERKTPLEDSTGTRRSSVKLGGVSSTSSGSPTVSTEKRKSTSSKRNSFLAMLSTDQRVSEMERKADSDDEADSDDDEVDDEDTNEGRESTNVDNPIITLQSRATLQSPGNSGGGTRRVSSGARFSAHDNL